MKRMIDYFQFKGRPFTREIPTRDCFSLPYLDDQVDELTKAVEMRMSALVMAPPGFGKTVILRRVKENLPEARYHVTYLKVTRLSSRDLCREISRAIGAKPAGSYPSLVRAVQRKMLDSSSAEGIRPVLLVDDAHALRDQGFELLKLLTNFEMDSKLVLSIILSGHNALKERLLRDDLADVKQRIIHCGELRLLSRDETKEYILHRLRLVGCSTAPFDQNSLEIIYEMSRGNMRAIDNLAYKSLVQAANKKEKIVNTKHVAAAGGALWT